MYTLGIDIGSTSSKAVILKDGTTLVSHAVEPLGTGTIGPQTALEHVFEISGLTREEIAFTVATGLSFSIITVGRTNSSVTSFA